MRLPWSRDTDDKSNKPKVYTNKYTGQLYVKSEERMLSPKFRKQLANLKKRYVAS